LRVTCTKLNRLRQAIRPQDDGEHPHGRGRMSAVEREKIEGSERSDGNYGGAYHGVDLPQLGPWSMLTPKC